MGDFNQDAFQRLMMMPGGAAGFGMSGAGRDQSFQDYMNKKMQEDAQRRAIEMLKGRGLFGAMQGASPDFKRRMFPQMGAIPGSMY